MKAGNDKLTVSIDKGVKERYKALCDQKGLKIGKQLELFMRKALEEDEEDS